MAEWLKAHDSKSCGPKGLGGSNPLASAIKIKKAFRSFFYFNLREDENRRLDRMTKRVKNKSLLLFF